MLQGFTALVCVPVFPNLFLNSKNQEKGKSIDRLLRSISILISKPVFLTGTKSSLF
jgi:hypothetical protein